MSTTRQTIMETLAAYDIQLSYDELLEDMINSDISMDALVRLLGDEDEQEEAVLSCLPEYLCCIGCITEPGKIVGSKDITQDTDSKEITIQQALTNVNSLPEGLTVIGDVDMTVPETSEYQFCKKLSGSFLAKMLKEDLTTLPKGMTIKGSLHLYNSKITELPENLTVTGDCYLDSTLIETLPKGLKVGGNLVVGPDTTSLPTNLSVGGLYWSCIVATELPAGLKVRHDLDVSWTNIRFLPNDLQVGGVVYASRYCNLTPAHDNLLVIRDMRATVYVGAENEINNIIERLEEKEPISAYIAEQLRSSFVYDIRDKVCCAWRDSDVDYLVHVVYNRLQKIRDFLQHVGDRRNDPDLDIAGCMQQYLGHISPELHEALLRYIDAIRKHRLNHQL